VTLFSILPTSHHSKLDCLIFLLCRCETHVHTALQAAGAFTTYSVALFRVLNQARRFEMCWSFPTFHPLSTAANASRSGLNCHQNLGYSRSLARSQPGHKSTYSLCAVQLSLWLKNWLLETQILVLRPVLGAVDFIFLCLHCHFA